MFKTEHIFHVDKKPKNYEFALDHGFILIVARLIRSRQQRMNNAPYKRAFNNTAVKNLTIRNSGNPQQLKTPRRAGKSLTRVKNIYFNAIKKLKAKSSNTKIIK